MRAIPRHKKSDPRPRDRSPPHLSTRKPPADIDEHSVLFLILYDIWVGLYGKKFADEQVEVEKKRRGPYPAAWEFALSMTKKERESKFREIVSQNREQ